PQGLTMTHPKHGLASNPEGRSGARSGAVGPRPADAPEPGPIRREPPRGRPRDAVPRGGARPRIPTHSPQSLPPHTDRPGVGARFRKNNGIPYCKGWKDLVAIFGPMPR